MFCKVGRLVVQNQSSVLSQDPAVGGKICGRGIIVLGIRVVHQIQAYHTDNSTTMFVHSINSHTIAVSHRSWKRLAI